jgi:hypothetical protein
LSLTLELIGEFRGKNTVYRVLPDGQIETSGQGMGKIMGVDAAIMFTTTGFMGNGLFVGEGTGVITTMTGETVTLQMNSIGWPSENGGLSRGASIQVADSEKLMDLNKIICLHEYVTEMRDNWVGKIWAWKP